jgi:hypothetical protein
MSPPDVETPPPGEGRRFEGSVGRLDRHQEYRSATTTLATWAARIRPYLEGAVEQIVAAGRELLAAKDGLPHGQFGDLLEQVGLNRRTAQRFMAIARHPLLSDATHGSHLPAAWTTLFELSRVEPEELEEAIEAGSVHPAMSTAEAKGTARTEGAGEGHRAGHRPDGRHGDPSGGRPAVAGRAGRKHHCTALLR